MSLEYRCTPDVVSKKHVTFDHGLDFLIVYQRHRGQTVEEHKKTNEK